MTKLSTARLLGIFLLLLIMSGSAWLMLTIFRDNVMYFYTPADVMEQQPPSDERFRLGGMVVDGSIEERDANAIVFTITDNTHEIDVFYQGLLPALFAEGQGMVAEGYWRDKRFIADRILAKHDENYMPPSLERNKP